MRKLLNTLYVTTPDAYLSKDGMNVVVTVKQQELFRIPVINIEGSGLLRRWSHCSPRAFYTW